MCHYSKHDLSTNRQINWSNEVKDALAIRRLVYSPSVCFPCFCCVSPPQSLSLSIRLGFYFFFSLSPLRHMSNVLKIAGFFALPQGLKCQQAHCHSKRFTSFSFIIVCLHLQQAHASLLNHSHKKTVVIQLIAVTHLWPSDIESLSLSNTNARANAHTHAHCIAT